MESQQNPAPVVPPPVPSVIVTAQQHSNVYIPVLVNNTISDGVSFSSTACTAYAQAVPTPTGKEDLALSTDVLERFVVKHKAKTKKKIECIFEGKKDASNKTLLKKVYTQLYITQGEFRDVNKEHEILKIDKAFTVQKVQEKTINCNEIFSEDKRVVLTKGIAGIGKTVSVQKFILDWAEGNANEDIHCIFLLPFREMNLIKDETYSLHEFLQDFYPELENLSDKDLYKSHKLLFVFDGLDESRLPLEFSTSMVRKVTQKAPVNDLITNLIEGKLLPDALIWITSRPAAANQIPPEFVSLFTEVRGFTDKQKEEYFTKRITNENEAKQIISQIRKSRSLYIMCHIPIFCWITATVLHVMLVENEGKDVPATLSEMYIHFLLIQMNTKNQKYDEKVERDVKKLKEMNRELILKLAKLAFKQLMKGNIMFYEEDLSECGIEVRDDLEYSGMCAEIFKVESVLHERKVYCFIHLSIQEFLAALHVFDSYLKKNMTELKCFFSEDPPTHIQLDVLLKKAVDQAKETANGHLDLFLRFLLGISLESNQNLLKGILTETQEDSKKRKKSINKVIQHIRQMQNISRALPPETAINHFFCLMELKDESLYNQIKKYLCTDNLPNNQLSPSNCSTLAYLMLISGDVFEELDPKKFNPSSSAYKRLVPAVRCFRKAWLAGCELTEEDWEIVASALEAENSTLRALDLSDNYRFDTGAKLLADGLKSPHCNLEILRLVRCHFSQSSCAELASALVSISSSLTELDLSNNDLQDTAVEVLFAGTENAFSKLEILRLSWCNLTARSCSFLSSLLPTLKELDLSNNDLQDSGVKDIFQELINDKQFNLQTLRLSGCLLTRDAFSFLESALRSNSLPALKDLDLSYNNPGDAGEKMLNNPNCNLKMAPTGKAFIKAGIKKYACELTFNPNTAHQHLQLSKQKVSYVDQSQEYPDHPERFQSHNHVLCNEGLNQRCYWEVRRKGSVDIAVTYSDIDRSEEDQPVWDINMKFGLNPISWALCDLHNDYMYARHNSEDSETFMIKGLNRIGVYLDWPAGRLSFYSVLEDTHTLTHIHTFITEFQKPVYPGFSINGGSVTLCQVD